MDAAVIWSILASTIVVAASYGGLLMRERSNRLRIDEVKTDTEADRDALRKELTALAEDQAKHRTETTDRLARMETTLNLVAAKVLNGD